MKANVSCKIKRSGIRREIDLKLQTEDPGETDGPWGEGIVLSQTSPAQATCTIGHWP